MPPGVRLTCSRASQPLNRYNAFSDLELPAPDLDVVLEHMNHAVKLIGVEHVCIGSDHGAVRFNVKGFEDCSKLPARTAKLTNAGYSESDVRLIMGARPSLTSSASSPRSGWAVLLEGHRRFDGLKGYRGVQAATVAAVSDANHANGQ